MKLEFYQTIKSQLEILPRFTILYGGNLKSIAFEWLWFGISYLKDNLK